jgi:competence protein ComEC
MDHVGGIQGALRGRKVETVLISPFKDERWGATGTNLYLQKTGAKIMFAERGVSGTLGDIDWQVLSPNHEAQGAEDSNDASIVMLWSARYFNLVTMADIGERGQMRMVADSKWWQLNTIRELPMVLKVSHHGSADQYPELIEQLDPELSLISVGASNSYGHPTNRTLGTLKKSGSQVLRTDQLGSIALSAGESGLIIANSPRLTG